VPHPPAKPAKVFPNRKYPPDAPDAAEQLHGFHRGQAPPTITDFGLRNEGGLFSRTSAVPASATLAPEYWYSGVRKLSMIFATSTTAPTYGLYRPAAASGVALAAPIKSAEGPEVSAATIDWLCHRPELFDRCWP